MRSLQYQIWHHTLVMHVFDWVMVKFIHPTLKEQIQEESKYGLQVKSLL
jgi:hypothetical protein